MSTRPGARALVKLPQLEKKQHSLETCVYCPKLCRSRCPVSNETATETLTPWGKMSMAYYMGRGDVSLDRDYARTAWACTGCKSCTAACDHENEVSETLHQARAALWSRGEVPEAARDAARLFRGHVKTNADKVHKVAPANPSAGVALLVGCSYEAEETKQALELVSALLGEPVDLVQACCGARLQSAGDRGGFENNAREFAARIEGKKRLIAVDPDCARSLVSWHQEPPVDLLVSVAAQHMARFGVWKDAPEVRYHDPCSLSRGFAITEEPRALLTRILGKAPKEFVRNRGESVCSGAGGLLPETMPEVATGIAARVLEEHGKDGASPLLVTACSQSLRAFKKQGAHATDLLTVLHRSLVR